jgi:hypothetical protein
MAKRRRSGEREAFWQAAVSRHQVSTQSVRAFCQRERLSEASFYAWRRTLRERQAAAPPSFVPLLLASPVASSSVGITIELRGGRVVRLPETMATERLIALLRGLEAGEVTP